MQVSMSLARVLAFCLLFDLISLRAASAAEGMWMPQQLPRIEETLRSAGLELDPDALSQLTSYPLGAVVSLGICTGSFVSPQGLVLTNHHCAYGSIQHNSSEGENLLRDGFRASTSSQELPAAPGTHVLVTVQVRDVTEHVLANAGSLAGARRMDVLEVNEKRLVTECERDPGHRCTVHSFHGGLEFHLAKQLEIRDVRLVYAPPAGVGRFGGETDNWMWPRHAGDFSFYRAYVGKDGKAADRSADNIAYQPPHHLRVARRPLGESAFVMIAGYPRRTNRHKLPVEIEHAFEVAYPDFVRAAGEQLEIIARETAGRGQAAIAYASTTALTNNYYKNRRGMLDSYAGSDLLERRRSLVQLPQLAREVTAATSVAARRDAIAQQEFLLDYATPRLLSVARTLHRVARETARPDELREPGYQSRDLPRIRESLAGIDDHYDERVDKALVRHFLTRYLSLPPAARNNTFLDALGLRAGMEQREIDARLDALYAGSALQSREVRAAWLGRDVADFRRSDDTFIGAAVRLFEDDRRRKVRDRQIAGDLQLAYAAYMRSFLAEQRKRGVEIYPDANATLRISYGGVAGRVSGSADGTAWTAFTTLRGIESKHTGAGEFDAPDEQLAAIRARRYGPYADTKLGSVPVNFLATLDITGGNSGSPVLDSRGELVGVAFDGTLDSVISDWDYRPAMRTMVVDVRYMLWQMQIVDGCDRLVREMGLP